MPLLLYVERASAATAGQLALLLGPLLVVGLLMHVVANQLQRGTIRIIGNRPYLFLFGWLGVIVHEGSHALLCVLFGHRITAIKWFDASAQGGSLGQVAHTWNRRSVYQSAGNFFIGTAPLFGGAIVLIVAATYLLDVHMLGAMRPIAHDDRALGSLDSLRQLGAGVWNGTGLLFASMAAHTEIWSWRSGLFLYLAIAVGSAASLSPSDLRGAVPGLGILVGLLLVLNVLTLWTSGFLTRAAYAGIHSAGMGYTIMLFALALNVLMVCIVTVLRATIALAGVLGLRR